MSETTQREKWEWFGHAAHLVVSRLCQFHLATKVGDYLVSTVGEYWPSRSSREIHAEVHDPTWLAKNRHRKGDDFDHAYMQRFGFEEIGVGRKYETVVFKATSRCTADGCGCNLPIPDDWTGLDFGSYNDAGSATRGHYAICEKWSAAVATPEGGNDDGC